MRTVVLLAAWLLLYGGPLLMVGVWLVRFRHEPESPRWRWVMSWVSLSLATVALGGWVAIFAGGASHDIEDSIRLLQHGFTTVRISLSGAFVAALFAKGKGRAWTMGSSLLIPLQWLIWRLG